MEPGARNLLLTCSWGGASIITIFTFMTGLLTCRDVQVALLDTEPQPRRRYRFHRVPLRYTRRKRRML